MDAASADGGGQRDGSTASDAGPPGCTSDAECDDGIDCTADTCTVATGACRHQVVPALCPAGSSCHPTRGCEQGRPCGTDPECADDDACTVNERCDPAARTCVVDPLDGDGDGDPPRVCGGGDCDDSRASVYAGADERCNTVDDDCDGRIDEGLEAAVCGYCQIENACGHEDMHACYARIEGALGECANRSVVAAVFGTCDPLSCQIHQACAGEAYGTCICDGGRTPCATSAVLGCLDLMNDDAHCGACGFWCPTDMMCAGGRCRCLDERLTNCGLRCVDTTTNRTHCGSCGSVCPSEATCIGGSCTCPAGLAFCAGVCVETATSREHCGSCGTTCSDDRVCSGGACVCTPGLTLCAGRCADTTVDAQHCGGCGIACSPSQACDRGVCATCGGNGQPCCGLDGAGGGTCAVGFWCDALRSGLCWPS